MRRRFAALAAAALLAWTAPAQAGPYGALYAFGDSLSDVGNVSALTSGLVPAAPYAAGRFSNGPVWVETLAAGLGLGSLAPSVLGGTDYAFGGAQTGTTPTHAATPLDLGAQFAAFSAGYPSGAPSDALYTVWIGSNDLLGALGGGSAAARATADAAAGNVQTVLRGLAAAGARDVLVATVSDLGQAPRLNDDPVASAAGSALAVYFNQNLLATLGADPLLAGLDLRVLDTYALIADAVVRPSAYGLGNVTDACLSGATNLAGGTPCANPDAYLFWDDLHPTAAAHAAIGRQALALVTRAPGAAGSSGVAAVPEPGSLVLLGAGVAALTWTRRRRAA